LKYLAYDDGTDNRYDLISGALITMPPSTGQHADIAGFSMINLEPISNSFAAGIEAGAFAVQLPPTEGEDSGRIRTYA